MTDKELNEIRHRAEQAQFGYSGARERDYGRDVNALLRELDLLKKSIVVLTDNRDDLAKRLQQQVETSELWIRERDTVQARVEELERRFDPPSHDDFGATGKLVGG